MEFTKGPQLPAGKRHFSISSSGSAFARLVDQNGQPGMFYAEVFLTARDNETGVISNVGVAELKFDRAELYPLLLKHIDQIVGPQMEAVQKEAESRIEKPSIGLVRKLSS